MLELLVIGVVLTDLWDSLGVAGLRLVILVLGKVDAAQRNLADGLVDAVACALLGGKDVVLDGLGGILTGEVEVADGIVDLVKILLVAVVAGHMLERAHLAGDVKALVDRALLDAGIELGAIVRAVAAAGALIGFVGQVLLSQFLIELTEQEVLSHLLRSLCALDGLGQIGHSLGGHVLFDVVVSIGQIGQRANAFVVDLVDVHVREHIVGLTGPAHSAIAQCFPNLGLLDQVGLPTEVAANETERG